MKANYQNLFEFLDLLLSKIESIENKLSAKADERKFKEYMNIAQLIEYLKESSAIDVSKSKVYKLVTKSSIPHRKVYGKLVFSKKEIDLWIDTQLNPTKSKNTITKKVSSKENNIKKSHL